MLSSSCLRQIATSDLILLNKIDLAPPSLVDNTEEAIRSINPTAPVYRTTKGNVPLERVLGVAAFEGRGTLIDSLGKGSERHIHDENCRHNHDDSSQRQHPHFVGISTLSIPLPASLTPSQEAVLDEWIRKLVWEGLYDNANLSEPNSRKGEDDTKEKESREEGQPALQILRLKGLYRNSQNETVGIQGVQTLYETTILEGVRPSEEDSQKDGKLVLIGSGLSERIGEGLVEALSAASLSKR